MHELLVQFAHQRLLGRLTGIYLAAGKLPEASHRLAFGALGDQDATVGIDQSDGSDQDQRAVAERRRYAGTIFVERDRAQARVLKNGSCR